MSIALTDYEERLLVDVASDNPGLPWGAAMGQGLEVLCHSGYMNKNAVNPLITGGVSTQYLVSKKGEEMVKKILAEKAEVAVDEIPDPVSEYDILTERDWIEGELATIEYDYKVHPVAMKRIRSLFDRLEGK
jgi:hypothetical protein